MKKDLAHKKLDFLVRLKQSIGDQKIDVVFDRGLQRSIDISAQRQGILLSETLRLMFLSIDRMLENAQMDYDALQRLSRASLS